MKSYRVFLIVLILAISVPAFAATFIVPTDRILTDKADAIAIGVVQDSRSAVGNGTVSTTVEILLEDAIKGPVVSGQLLDLHLPGGRTPELSLVIHGVPTFGAGDRVLLFLVRHKGVWTLEDYALGKFAFRSDENGDSYLMREGDQICGWDMDRNVHVEPVRRAEPFLQFVRDVVAGGAADLSYTITEDEACPTADGLRSAVAPLTAFAASDYLSFCNCRWPNFESTTTSWETSGTQTGISDSLGAVDAGTGAWANHGDSTIAFDRGGTNSGTCSGLFGPGCSRDVENTVLFNDPSDEIAGSFTGSGTLAAAGPFFGGSHTFSGESFANIVRANAVVQDGVSGATGISQDEFEATIAHELGHALGFRHSNQGCGSCDNVVTALMASLVNNGPGNASLLAWDQRAAAAAYGSGACTAVSIASHPQSTSINKGSTATLSVSTSGTAPIAYQWYEGTSPSTTTPVGTDSSSFTTPALTSETSYWVRASNCTSDTADSNTATVSVSCDFSISSQPQSVSIGSGATTTLTVGTNPSPGSGGSTYSFEWFQGNSGDTSTPVGTNSASFTTPALTEATSYWVRVTRTDCDPDVVKSSSTATVSICTPPSITTQPQDATVQSGSGTTLSVVAEGTAPLEYQWFRNTTGNTFQSIFGATSSSFNTGNLTSTQRYLVVVFNPCAPGPDPNNGIASAPATVTVTTSCTPPSINIQPLGKTINEGETATLSVSASGTSLNYQWFQGASGVTSTPVGTNSPSFTTPVLTETTSYWVRVTNSCGGVNSLAAAVNVTPACPAGKLCSLESRFELGLAVRDHRTGRTGFGVPLQQNDLFGFFSLPDFTGDPNNPEVFVKMLDGRIITGDFWVFFGGLTDLEYTLTVEDKVDGGTKTYFKSGGTSNGGFDTGIGVAPETCAGESPGAPLASEAPTICGSGTDRLCLNGGRFKVELAARDPRTGNTGAGLSIPQSDLFGYFAIPDLTSDPSNPEVFIKVVDGRIVNNFFWIFYSGLTDFEYTLTVTDTFTGQKKSYNKAGGSACGAFDTNAF